MDDLPSLRAALDADLRRTLGFLPRQVPADVLPDEWQPWLNAARDLAERFTGEGARAWLAASFSTESAGMGPSDALAAAATNLPEPEADRLLTTLSVLGHAYRWDRVPPEPEEYQRTKIELPMGLAAPWAALCARYGHPRVGNLASMVTSNWRISGKRGGDGYDAVELLDGAADPAVLWLSGEKADALRAFLRTGIETEAAGARLVLTAVRLVESALARNAHRCGWLLERLHGELAAMGKPFKAYIQRQHFTGDDFLTLIQPATLWGIDEGEGILEGASGPQLGCLQVADAILGVSRASPMGESVMRTRRFLPARHRRFLECADVVGPQVRAYIRGSGDRQLAGLFNACASALKAWRLVHQKRGAMYLRSETAGVAAAYTSTGGVVALEDERVARFEGAMQERITETDDVFIPLDAEPDAPRPFRFLSELDALALHAAAWRRDVADGGILLAKNTRGAGLFVLRAGTAEVRDGVGTPLATLEPGDVFGEVSYIDNVPTVAEVVAVGSAIVDVLPREHLHVLCETRAGFGERFHLSLAGILADRLRLMNARVSGAE